MAVYRGIIKAVKWQDPETGYFRATFEDEAGGYGVPCGGYGPDIYPGQPVELAGGYYEEPGDVPGSVRSFLDIQKIRLYTKSEAGTRAFLAGLPGIGPKTADLIADYTGADIWHFIAGRTETDAAAELAAIKGVGARQARAVVETAAAMTDDAALIKAVAHIGGTYQQARILKKALGKKAAERIAKNPYLLAEAGIAWDIQERLAQEARIEQHDPRRRAGIVSEILRRSASDGSTAAEIYQAAALYESIERAAGYTTTQTEAVQALTQEHTARKVLANAHMYIQHDASAYIEQALAEEVRRIQDARSITAPDSDAVQETETALGITYDATQRAAFLLIDRGGIGLLTGGPGTGKTETVQGLITYYEKKHPGEMVLTAAPTAAAARRMSYTGQQAETIHRTLKMAPGQLPGHDRAHPLHAGLIIIDESSMIDETTALYLLRAVPDGAAVLFVGDADQLPPVGGGQFFADMIRARETARAVCIRLTTNHRQGAGGVIAENAARINRGETALVKSPAFRRYTASDPDSLTRGIVDLARALYDPEDPESCLILTPVRSERFHAGARQINARLQDLYNPDMGQPYFTAGRQHIRAGSRVTFTRNSYSSGYINGEAGIVESVETAGRRQAVTVRKDDGERVDVTTGSIADIDLGYCETMHKAQGREARTVIAILPEGAAHMETRQLLYVAVTRAREQVIIISEEPGAVTRAIRHDAPAHITTLLPHYMKGGMTL